MWLALVWIATVCTLDPEAGLLQIDVATSLLMAQRVVSTSREREIRENTKLESKLEQAIFFAHQGEFRNPLSFKLSNITGDIDSACVDISNSILMSKNQHLKSLLDFASVLRERMIRIDQIIHVINENDLISKVVTFDLVVYGDSMVLDA